MARQTYTLAFVRDNYFIFGVFFCILLAELAPWIGALGGYIQLLSDLLNGLTIKWKELSRTVKQCPFHIFIQIISFFYIPVFVQVFLFVLKYVIDLDPWIHKGLIIVSCMPPPVSSAVILVKSIGDNEAAAVFNSALGSILGILLTPVLFLYHVGISSSVPILKITVQLILTMIFPLVLGQIFQKAFSAETLASFPFSVFGQISLLCVVYTSFYDMFVQEELSADTHLILITILFGEFLTVG